MDMKKMANAVRMLAVDMIEKAKSGHPGLPLGMADVATVLWTKFLRFDAGKPEWADRDRFILSGGHGSAMLYSLLYLTGFADVTLEEVQNFRQLGSRTAGHPERTLISGVDYSTGPLGQGIAGAVGMALAERMLNARYGDALVNHRTYVMAGDGDLMEGISEEAIALAGHWRLNRLIVLWDDNRITIDGETDIATSTDMKKRFEANGWFVLSCDGHDTMSIETALERAQTSDKPVLIACRTVIGFGAPTKQGTPKVHGSPLGSEEVVGLRQALSWPYAPFEIPSDIKTAWEAVGIYGEGARRQWEERLNRSGNKDVFMQEMSGELPRDLAERMRDFKKEIIANPETMATRQVSRLVLTRLKEIIPNLIGGSADLDAACMTRAVGTTPVMRLRYDGNHIHYGIREHAMGAIMTGVVAHGGFIPYGGTFLSFVDYMKPAIRLAALMELRELFVLTHDSIGVGEDGPTHQPIEQLSSLRATPNLLVFRPADAIEVAESYEVALQEQDTPSALVFARQATPAFRTDSSENKTALGGYVVCEPDGERQATIIATGTEVSLALSAAKMLGEKGVGVAVVSMPCVELFERQPMVYREAVLGQAPRLIVEAASTWGWDRFLGEEGAILGIDSFGASGKGGDVMAHFGFAPEHVMYLVLQLLEEKPI